MTPNADRPYGSQRIALNVQSEVGRLRYVMVHAPGAEVANMIPEERVKLLFDDILDLQRAQKEHEIFRGMLGLIAPDGEDPRKYVLDPADLLEDVLERQETRDELIRDVCLLENLKDEARKEIDKDTGDMSPKDLGLFLLSGEVRKSTRATSNPYESLDAFVAVRPYKLRPIPNLMFTCDSAIVVNEDVILCNMQYPARLREPLLMRYIFERHPLLAKESGPSAQDRFLFNKLSYKDLKTLNDSYNGYSPTGDDEQQRVDPERIEGGDVLRINSETLFIGTGQRTTQQGIDRLVANLKKRGSKNTIKEIYAVILPRKRETIHLDTIFTMVDRRACLIFAPLMLPRGERRVRVVKIEVPTTEEEKPRITEQRDLLSVLSYKLGIEEIDLSRFHCGGLKAEETWSLITMEREQWTDGANSFALRPGFILGYERNRTTAEGFREMGYRIYGPDDYLEDYSSLDIEGMRIKEASLRELRNVFEDPSEKCVVLIPGQELSRARGGPRCMSMPLVRDSLG